MMELLYTVTWGRESLPFEVEEWYGYYSQEDWQQLAAALSAPGGPGLRLVYFTQYLQPGYVSLAAVDCASLRNGCASPGRTAGSCPSPTAI